MTDTTIGDVDIFLICPVDEASDKLREIFEAIQEVHKKKFSRSSDLLITRSKHAVTIFTVFSDRVGGYPIQVILSVYPSTYDLLRSFDVDCCCCAYEPTTKKVAVSYTHLTLPTIYSV